MDSLQTTDPLQTTRRTVLALVPTTLLAGCGGLLGPSFPEDAPEPPEKLASIVETFLERVHAGEYEAATERFDPELAEALPPEELGSTWEDETGHLGRYEGVQEWAHETEDGNDVVYARVSMTEGGYDVQVTLNDDRQLVGVYIIEVRA